jgi:hypothetical protein
MGVFEQVDFLVQSNPGGSDVPIQVYLVFQPAVSTSWLVSIVFAMRVILLAASHLPSILSVRITDPPKTAERLLFQEIIGFGRFTAPILTISPP